MLLIVQTHKSGLSRFLLDKNEIRSQRHHQTSPTCQLNVTDAVKDGFWRKLVGETSEFSFKDRGHCLFCNNPLH